MSVVVIGLGNVLLSDAISEASESVGKGQGLATSLGDSDLFPGLSIQMILVGVCAHHIISLNFIDLD